LDGVRRELGVSDRTLDRYLKVCQDALVDRRGRPLIAVEERQGRRVLRLGQPFGNGEASNAGALPLYFTLTLLLFLDRSGLVDGLEDVWARLGGAAGRGTQPALNDLSRKLVAMPQGLREGTRVRERLLAVLRGVLEQRRLRLDYDVEGGEGEAVLPDAFDPYTLAVIDGDVAVIGRRHGDDAIVRLPLETIRAAAVTDVRFEYPKRYAPDRYADGIFDTCEREREVEVSLLVRGENAVRLVRSRRLHPSQRFIRQQGAAAVLSMRVACTDELKRWILSFGPDVEVIAPRALRDAVCRAHEEAAAVYVSQRALRTLNVPANGAGASR